MESMGDEKMQRADAQNVEGKMGAVKTEIAMEIALKKDA